jgi:uncharacterized membrane protein YiaA
MKNTKIMVAFVATTLLTWLLLGLIIYLLSSMNYKQSMCNHGTFFAMLLLGWVPGIIVGADLEEKLNN